MNEREKAIDKWLATDQGKFFCDGATIRLPPSNNQYLENLIRRAFMAGFDETRKAREAEGHGIA